MPFIMSESWKEPCRHPEHDPPTAIVLPAGRHTYQCPACKQTQILVIRLEVCQSDYGERPIDRILYKASGRHGWSLR